MVSSQKSLLTPWSPPVWSGFLNHKLKKRRASARSPSATSCRLVLLLGREEAVPSPCVLSLSHQAPATQNGKGRFYPTCEQVL